jgi:hypothetical protein
MFGVKLRPGAVTLLKEVGKLYGKPVKKEEYELVGFHGRTRIDEDGTPVIILNPSTGKTEETIVHELFHLKMIGEGSPTISSILPAATSVYQQERILWMERQLRGAIQHWMFYLQMRKMGLKPDRDLNAEVQQVLAGSLLTDLTADKTRFEIPVLYARISLESEDSELKTQYIECSESKMEKASIERAKQMIDHVTKTQPRTPEEEVQVFLQCLNYLYNDIGFFISEPWGYKPKRKFRLRTIAFRFEPK